MLGEVAVDLPVDDGDRPCGIDAHYRPHEVPPDQEIGRGETVPFIIPAPSGRTKSTAAPRSREGVVKGWWSRYHSDAAQHQPEWRTDPHAHSPRGRWHQPPRARCRPLRGARRG